MSITKNQFSNQFEEQTWVCNQILSLIESGENPQEIAIITRSHKSLQPYAVLLEKNGIQFNYEKGENILDNKIITELITIAEYAYSLFNLHNSSREDLLPVILGYEFLEIEPWVIWDISNQAHQKQVSWLEIMKNHSEKKVKKAADLLVSLAKVARSVSAHGFIDYCLGVNEFYKVPENEDDEVEFETESYQTDRNIFSEGCISPMKKYYFDVLLEKQDYSQYLQRINLIRSLLQSVHNHYSKQNINIGHLLAYIGTLRNNKLSIRDLNNSLQSENCVNILSVHKSKGLEFKHVFIVNCSDQEWIGNKKGLKLSLPRNLPLLPEEDSLDDKIRLLYVAITRAKDSVTLTVADTDLKGKSLTPLLLISEKWEKIQVSPELIVKNFAPVTGNKPVIDFKQDQIIDVLLENYSLSVTHLINFLNIAEAGPNLFLENNLLRFPKQKSPSASYGTAVHSALNEVFAQYKRTNSLPSLNFFVQKYEDCISDQRLSQVDLEYYLSFGKEQLTQFYNFHSHKWNQKSLCEFSFKDQGVVIGSFPLTGKVDRIDFISENTIKVVDYKTGKTMKTWTGGADEKIKSWKYKTQLLFYKLLIERSKDFGKQFTVDKGGLEFVEADNGEPVCLDLDLDRADVDQLSEVIESVSKKIISKDFLILQTDHYPKNYLGIQQFIDDLLTDKVIKKTID